MKKYSLYLQRVVRTGEEDTEPAFWDMVELEKLPGDKLYEYPGKEGFWKILEANEVTDSETIKEGLHKPIIGPNSYGYPNVTGAASPIPLSGWGPVIVTPAGVSLGLTGAYIPPPDLRTSISGGVPFWNPNYGPKYNIPGDLGYEPSSEKIHASGIVDELKEKANPQDAAYYLKTAQEAMQARAKLRDRPTGERSMKATVEAFNGLTGRDLTEQEGWEFMVLLKMVRGRQGTFNADDYVDGSAYFALLGEANAKNR